jgi:hypothetical protein
MILVEGIDGSGKTELVNQLASDLGIAKHKFRGPPEDKNEWDRRCNLSRTWFTQTVIQDRTPFISECAYGCMTNRNPYITIDETLQIMREYAPILIYCRPTRFLHNLSEFDTSEYVESLKLNWSIILSMYDGLMARLHAIRYDWTRGDLSKLAYENIVQICRIRLKQAGS